MKHVVETDWLENQLGSDALRVVDASWYLPDMERDARGEYLARHIPGAVYFDLDVISDQQSHLPHMLPAPEAFSAAAGGLGIAETDRIVVYDSAGLFSAGRVWWMFKVMGAKHVSILNGGLKAWAAESRPLESGPVSPQHADFTAAPNPGMVRSLADIKTIIADGSASIADARPRGRFTAQVPEPRAGLRSGHMPGSFSTPIDQFLQRDGRMKPLNQLKAVFERAGVDLARPVVTSCGSGVTAAVPYLALTLLGLSDIALYDGSWAEWGGATDTLVETG